MRSVSVFGATGSIGESTFDLLMGQGGPAAYRTVALTGGRNIARLAETIIPMGRGGAPEEMAEAVAFLASDAASYFVGETIVASGGLTFR